MAKALSVDLRNRVVAAVEGGLSRRKAAERFGVSISSAIRWTTLSRFTGACVPDLWAAISGRGGSRRVRR